MEIYIDLHMLQFNGKTCLLWHLNETVCRCDFCHAVTVVCKK
jgi:hypothetical protein